MAASILECSDIASLSIYMSSDEIHSCNRCETKRQREREATVYCQDCETFLCKKCYKRHEKSYLSYHDISILVKSETSKENNDTTIDIEKGKQQNMALGDSVTHEHKESSVECFTSATLLENINVSFKTDQKPCEIYGIIVDGQMLYMTDHENEQVKQLSRDRTVLKYAVIPQAWGICDIDGEKLAVSGENVHIIEKNTLKKLVTIKTRLLPRGLSFYNDHLYVVVRGGSNLAQVQVFTLDGKLTRRIEPLLKGRQVLTSPEYIAINQHNGNLYVTDWEKGILGLSESEKVIYVEALFERDGNDQAAEGVAIDDRNDIYICGLNTHNVMKGTTTGNLVRVEELISGCRFAQAVAVNGNKLYLCCRETNLVRVYELS